jgi:hypothetical protein
MEEFIIKPFGGLGNRLLVLDSCIKIQRNIKPKRTTIIWERNDNFYSKFSNLFELPDELTFKETVGFSRFKPVSYFQIYNTFHPSHYRWSWFNRLFGKERKYQHSIYAEDIEKILDKNDNLLPAYDKSVYLSFYQRFFDDANPFYNFSPKESLRQEIDEVTAQFQKKTIGIHIRRTDHLDAISNSPTESFIKKIQKYLSVSEVEFYLSTDDPVVKKLLKTKFGKRIKTRDVSYSRSSKKGIEDAVVDLFCLSRTSKIWGSYNSTFGQVASEMGNIEFKVIRN